MNNIPPKLKKKMSEDPYYLVCARVNSDCEGRITWEHAWIYASRQIQEPWAIIPLCVRHHLGDLLDKKENQRISLCRATDEDLAKYPKKDWNYEKNYLKIYA